jgi:hypothetical protein
MRKLRSLSEKSKILLLIVVTLAIPVTVYLVRSFVLNNSRASGTATFSFSPSNPVLPPNSTLRVMVNSGSSPVAFAHINFTFDKTKINLSDEFQTTSRLATVAQKTTKSEANTTGTGTAVIALSVGATAPTGSFELLTIPLTAITAQTSQSAFSVIGVQLVDTSGSIINAPTTSANISLNPTAATIAPTAAPSVAPTSSPTLRPTATPSTSPRPTTPASASADTVLSFNTATTQVKIGNEFSVAVNINTNTNSVVGSELYIKFDPARLQALDITPGSFITNGTVAQKNIDNTQGRISYTILLPTQTQPVQGQGTVANISFKPKTSGTTSLTWEPSTIIGAVGANAQNVLRTSNPLSLTITRVPGDINLDGKVNILDYVILFENFGLSTLANPLADLNGDNRVNTLDYVILFENFGHGE